MSTRTERRKQLRENNISKKDLKKWEAEYLKLPPIIKKIFVSLQNKVVVPMDTFTEARKQYPQYWNEENKFEPIKLS